MKRLGFIFAVVFFLSLPFNCWAAEGDYTEVHWDTKASGSAYPVDITSDGNYFWIVDLTDKEVYRYAMDGTYNDVHWDISGTPQVGCMGLFTDSNYIWIADYTYNKVFKYNMLGVYQDESWELVDLYPEPPLNNEARGITSDGNFFWVVNHYTGNERVYKYNMSGVYQEFWETGMGYPHGITTDGTNIWIVEPVTDEVWKFDMDGTYVAKWSTQSGGPRGITLIGGYFYITDSTNDEVYQYEGPEAVEKTSNIYTDYVKVEVSYTAHDVAVIGIIAPGSVAQGDTAVIDVNVANEGTFTETFDVVLEDIGYPPEIGRETITSLGSSQSTTVSFDWVTDASTELGEHTLEATAVAVDGEVDTADNSMTTVVEVTAVNLSVSVSPGSWGIDNISEGAIESTFASGTQGYFIATNDGNTTENLNIKVAQSSPSGWTPSDTQGFDTFVMGHGQATGTGYTTEGTYTPISETGVSLISNLASTETHLFDLQFQAPTETDDGGVDQTITFTIEAQLPL